MKIVLQKELQGKILDIGGGGEGIIGRLYGPQVIAIDYRQDELDEAPASCEKRLMDATALDFADVIGVLVKLVPGQLGGHLSDKPGSQRGIFAFCMYVNI